MKNKGKLKQDLVKYSSKDRKQLLFLHMADAGVGLTTRDAGPCSSNPNIPN